MTPTQVGPLLREWRERRRLSQLELAVEAGVSARHVSFVENGRARPSPEMVLHLAERLDVPLRERNQLLLSAGYAPVYGQRTLDDAGMEPVRNAIELVLAGHEPYPALVVDQHWTMVAANRGLAVITDGVAPELLEPPVNVLRVALHPDGLATRIVNLAEWRTHLLERLDRQIAATNDPVLVKLRDELTGFPAPASDGREGHGVGVAGTAAHGNGNGAGKRPATTGAQLASDIVVSLRLRVGDAELAFFSTIATFGTAVDVTISELAIESFFPADRFTAEYLQSR
ncbi:MAG TPA: helix-turn-helix domain-containing protein [Acidimicrobiales bacterium]|nr:helix-turn-helix domain-containing protein [Acidimicrobiales bacterium]